jgi:hypothetical protein
MSDQAMSPLRRRMIEDMTIRKLAPKTQHNYLQKVKNFAAYLGRSPDTASSEDVRRYQLHLTASGVGVPTINQTISTLRFFFKVTLGRPDLVERATFVREPRKLPVVLSPEEVARLLDGAPSLKYKAALSVAYGAGLRVSEVMALKDPTLRQIGEFAETPRFVGVIADLVPAYDIDAVKRNITALGNPAAPKCAVALRQPDDLASYSRRTGRLSARLNAARPMQSWRFEWTHACDFIAKERPSLPSKPFASAGERQTGVTNRNIACDRRFQIPL